MSKLNPYEDFLDGRPVEVILAATPEAIRSLLARIGDANTSTRPLPGKWSPAEIVCHLADCDLVFGFRLRQTLAEDGPTIQPFDQDKWAAQYAGIPAARALESLHCAARMESAPHSIGASPGGQPHHDASRARRYELPDGGGDHGRPRPESPCPIAQNRRPGVILPRLFSAWCRSSRKTELAPPHLRPFPSAASGRRGDDRTSFCRRSGAGTWPAPHPPRGCAPRYRHSLPACCLSLRMRSWTEA